jgi:hypothetical protein
MTRKHFEALAAALKNSKPTFPDHLATVQWKNDVSAIADACATINPNFDKDRFKAVCGLK